MVFSLWTAKVLAQLLVFWWLYHLHPFPSTTGMVPPSSLLHKQHPSIPLSSHAGPAFLPACFCSPWRLLSTSIQTDQFSSPLFTPGHSTPTPVFPPALDHKFKHLTSISFHSLSRVAQYTQSKKSFPERCPYLLAFSLSNLGLSFRAAAVPAAQRGRVGAQPGQLGTGSGEGLPWVHRSRGRRGWLTSFCDKQ